MLFFELEFVINNITSQSVWTDTKNACKGGYKITIALKKLLVIRMTWRQTAMLEPEGNF